MRFMMGFYTDSTSMHFPPAKHGMATTSISQYRESDDQTGGGCGIKTRYVGDLEVPRDNGSAPGAWDEQLSAVDFWSFIFFPNPGGKVDFWNVFTIILED